MTRMMKIVPARRAVTDASPEPPNIERSRAITPAGGAVADGASITATAENPSAPHGAAIIRPINHSLRFGLCVVPAKAGIHNHRRCCLGKAFASMPKASPRRMGPGVRRDDARLLQIDIEFVSAVAAGQGQFERRAFGVRAGRQAVELE